ncbi:MAG: hypothetical protein AB1523_06630 [Bacillota bacterium]
MNALLFQIALPDVEVTRLPVSAGSLPENRTAAREELLLVLPEWSGRPFKRLAYLKAPVATRERVRRPAPAACLAGG